MGEGLGSDLEDPRQAYLESVKLIEAKLKKIKVIVINLKTCLKQINEIAGKWAMPELYIQEMYKDMKLIKELSGEFLKPVQECLYCMMSSKDGIKATKTLLFSTPDGMFDSFHMPLCDSCYELGKKRMESKK